MLQPAQQPPPSLEQRLRGAEGKERYVLEQADRHQTQNEELVEMAKALEEKEASMEVREATVSGEMEEIRAKSAELEQQERALAERAQSLDSAKAAFKA